MTTARRLLRLYPPAWRARYGEEFLAMAGEGGQLILGLPAGWGEAEPAAG